jgi:hypothetical protein
MHRAGSAASPPDPARSLTATSTRRHFRRIKRSAHLQTPRATATKVGASLQAAYSTLLRHSFSTFTLRSHLRPAPCLTGDNWKVDCEGTFWERDSIVTLKHKETGMVRVLARICHPQIAFPNGGAPCRSCPLKSAPFRTAVSRV